MDGFWRRACAAIIRRGTLRVTTAHGRIFTVGDGTGRPLAVRFRNAATEIAVLFDPDLRLGEAYMDGPFVVEEGTIADFLALALAQAGRSEERRVGKGWVSKCSGR